MDWLQYVLGLYVGLWEGDVFLRSIASSVFLLPLVHRCPIVHLQHVPSCYCRHGGGRRTVRGCGSLKTGLP